MVRGDSGCIVVWENGGLGQKNALIQGTTVVAQKSKGVIKNIAGGWRRGCSQWDGRSQVALWPLSHLMPAFLGRSSRQDDSGPDTIGAGRLRRARLQYENMLILFGFLMYVQQHKWFLNCCLNKHGIALSGSVK